MTHILVDADDPVVAEALADILTGELGCEVRHLQKQPDALLGADLIVATAQPSAGSALPVVLCDSKRPRHIARILAEISALIAEQANRPMPLSATILLHKDQKKLEHTPDGRHVELTEKELALLSFVQQMQEVSREDILKAVWGVGEGVHTATFETHLYRLRQKWREIADYDCIQATVGGYRWYDSHH